ncbi:MAG: hypothetical protein WCV70_03510 [Patescibacteria group bacterium]|jgi:hypothetical protein
MFKKKSSGKKLKNINCVNCQKFCQKEDLNKLRQLINKAKAEGHDGIKFNCQTGQQIIKNISLT